MEVPKVVDVSKKKKPRYKVKSARHTVNQKLACIVFGEELRTEYLTKIPINTKYTAGAVFGCVTNGQTVLKRLKNGRAITDITKTHSMASAQSTELV